MQEKYNIFCHDVYKRQITLNLFSPSGYHTGIFQKKGCQVGRTLMTKGSATCQRLT